MGASCKDLAKMNAKRLKKECRKEEEAERCPVTCSVCARRLEDSPCFDSCSERCEAVCSEEEEPVAEPEEPEEPEGECEDTIRSCKKDMRKDSAFCDSKNGQRKCKKT